MHKSMILKDAITATIMYLIEENDLHQSILQKLYSCEECSLREININPLDVLDAALGNLIDNGTSLSSFNEIMEESRQWWIENSDLRDKNE